MADLIGQSLGRYQILEQLGEGGMATVYKAYDTRLERDVAIKIIRKGAFPADHVDRILKRFEREAKALARLSHPNIVKVHDYGEHEGSPYLVMEYLPSGTLKQKMGKPIPWQEAIQTLLPIAEALDYAHSQNMVHRDVKPSNILLTQRGQPMLTDFGIAKMLDVEETLDLTGTSAAVGTPEYMAPEQATAKTADHRADIYALGVVLYEMVTGRKPFIADTPMAVLIKHATEPLPRPRQFLPGLPDEVEKILLKALAKKPEDRYPSMAEMALAFEKLTSVQVKKSAARNQTQSPHMTRSVREFASKEHSNSKFKLPKGIRRSVYWTAGLAVLVFGITLLSSLNRISSPEPVDTQLPNTEISSPTTHFNTPANTVTVELLSTSTFNPEPTLGVGSIMISEKDGMTMVYVPEGAFTMGTDTGYAHEGPAHKVFLDAFWIDQNEVTNAQYAICVAAGECSYPLWQGGFSPSYFTETQYADYPIRNVNWLQAKSYCEWAGKRLPTEAEWEKAARGIDGRIYPWGNETPTCRLANIPDCVSLTSSPILNLSPVGSYPDGISPYGALDMIGNVWEWVADWYDEKYYAESPESNPQGASTGTQRLLRGGSTNQVAKAVTRTWTSPDKPQAWPYGFRCARDVGR